MSSSGSRTHDYKCHGTTTLFAALNTGADEILTDHRLGTAARKAAIRAIRGERSCAFALGIGLLAIFITILIIVNGRAIAHRRRLAEKLLGDLVRSRAEERGGVLVAPRRLQRTPPLRFDRSAIGFSNLLSGAPPYRQAHVVADQSATLACFCEHEG